MAQETTLLNTRSDVLLPAPFTASPFPCSRWESFRAATFEFASFHALLGLFSVPCCVLQCGKPLGGLHTHPCSSQATLVAYLQLYNLCVLFSCYTLATLHRRKCDCIDEEAESEQLHAEAKQRTRANLTTRSLKESCFEHLLQLQSIQHQIVTRRRLR
jgi:hypothetical protein